MPPVEILARISISGWQQRLWTFSEGQLARRIWFQFKDQAVDLHSLSESWQSSFKENRIPARASASVELEMTALFTATALLQRQLGLRDVLHLEEIRTALSTCQTSWMGDEPLCLASVLQVGVSKIIEAPDHGKMAAFWQQLEYLPVGVIFAPIVSKLDNFGSRWAPTSLLGGANNHAPWLQQIDHPDAYARPSPNGLVVMLPAILFIAGNKSKPTQRMSTSQEYLLELFFDDEAGPEDVLHFRHDNGGWFRCSFKQNWHQNLQWTDDYTQVPALLLDLSDEVESEIDLINSEQLTFGGVFVTYKRDCGDGPKNKSPTNVKAHSHVWFAKLQIPEGAYLDKALECAETIWKEHQHEIEPLAKAEEVDNLLNKLLPWMNVYAMKDDLCRSFKEQRSADFSDSQALLGCAFDVRYFLCVGDWYKIEGAAGRLWCID